MSRGGPTNPAVDRDKRSMERKKRVTEVLEDQFRNELEGIVVSQKEGNKPLFHAGMKITCGCGGGGEFKGLANIRQVNDLHGSIRDKYSKAERQLRCKLAALYRLTAHFEWHHIIYSHITARLPDNENHYLINPYGMQYSEITASSLIKIDRDGNIIDPGSTVLPVNKAGFKLNSALHDIGQNVVYHTHSHAGTAISAMKCGLLNLCQEAIIVRPVSYGTYQGFVPNKAEQIQLGEDLAADSHVMILENHGLVSVAATIEEAFLWMAQLTKACEIQWRVLRCGRDNLTDRTFDSNEAFEGDLPVELVCNPNGVEYGKGELEFESYMRMLDNQGANTGYPYKTPSLFKDQVPSYPTVQYPPIVPGMEGPPSDTDRSKTGPSQRSAWFRNNIPLETRISPPTSEPKSDTDSKGKGGDGKIFAPFDSVVSPPPSRSGSSSGSSSRGGRRKRSSLSSSSSDAEAPPRPPLPSKRKHSRKSSSSGSSPPSDKVASEGSEGFARILPDGKLPEDEAASEGSSGSGYERLLSGGKLPEGKQADSSFSSSEGGGPDRPPLAQDSSEGGYHSTYSGSETDEDTTHGYISEQCVEQELFVNGVPMEPQGSTSSGSSSREGSTGSGSSSRQGSTSSGSSLLEVPSVTIRSVHSSSDSDLISDPSSDGKRSDEAEIQSLSDDSPSLDVVVEGDLLPSLECESLDELEEFPLVQSGRYDPVEEAGKWMRKRIDKLGESGVLDPDKIPVLSRDVSVDAKMSVSTDEDVEHDIGVEVEVRVGEDGVEIQDEITYNTVTTSIIEITEIQEDEFEVITIQPGQLTDDQKGELIRQGYVLQEN